MPKDTSARAHVATVQGRNILAGVRSKGVGYVNSASTAIVNGNVSNSIRLITNPLLPIIFSSTGTTMPAIYDIPLGYTTLTYKLVGGGGGGSGRSVDISGGGGGGGGYSYGTLTLTPDWFISVSLGAAGASSTGQGLNGGETSLTRVEIGNNTLLVSAGGGLAGTFGIASQLVNRGAGTIPGGNGIGYADASYNTIGGRGGVSGSNGTDLTSYGGGGGGGGTRVGTATNGGSAGTLTAGGAGGPGYYYIEIT